MKKIAPILIGVLICVLIFGVSYFWASGLMDSVYAYQSPLHHSPPIPGEAIGKPITRSVVVVLADGLRYDTSLDSKIMPYLNQLRIAGASAEMHSRPPSFSQPGYSALLTGAWPDINDGPILNWTYADIPTLTQDNIYSDAHKAGYLTAFSGSNWFEKLIPQEAVTRSFYTTGEDQLADREVLNSALPWLRSGMYQLMMIHLDQVDYAGHHEGGPVGAQGQAAASRVDALIQEIAMTMDLTKDTLLIVSDHGHINQGGHGGQDAITLLEPFVMVGKSVMPGKYSDIQMVDVAPTIAVLLGTSVPAVDQGHPQVAMLDLTLAQVDQINNTIKKQQAQLVQAYQTAIGHKVTVQQTSDMVTSSQAGIQAARTALLENQILPRGIIAIIIIFLLINLVAWHARPYFRTMLFGVVGYLAVFNAKYLLIDFKTYSLSSLVSQTNYIGSTALTVLLSLLVGWIIVMIGTKIYKFKPRKSADVTMKFILVLLVILFIPILVNCVINGVMVTWTLPDFLFGFLGLIFLTQTMMVAVLGLFFTGLAALLGMLTHPKYG